MANWADLPCNLLHVVLDKLLEHNGYTIFSTVCHNWRSACKQRQEQNGHKFPPMLMIPAENYGEKRGNLYSISQRKRLFNLPVPYKERCHGSSYGWLARANRRMSITLICPFRSDAKKIRTPPLKFRPSSWPIPVPDIYKVMLTADPNRNPHDFAIVAIYSRYMRLAYYKPSMKAWTYLDKELTFFSDVIVYRGLVYAVGRQNHMIAFDVNSNTPGTFQEVASKVRGAYCDSLVETSRGELLQIVRLYQREATSGFRLYKLILDETTNKLIHTSEVTDMGTEAVFVGDNNAFCVSVKDYKGYQPNSIYYTLGNERYVYDRRTETGIFSLANRTCTLLFERNSPEEHVMGRTFWIELPLP